MKSGFGLIRCNFSFPSLRMISHFKVPALEIRGIGNGYEFDAGFISGAGYTGKATLDRDSLIATVALEPASWPLTPRPFMFSTWNRWYIAAAKRNGFGGGMFGRGDIVLTSILATFSVSMIRICRTRNARGPPKKSAFSV